MEKLDLEDALEDTPQVNQCIFIRCQAFVFSNGAIHTADRFRRFVIICQMAALTITFSTKP